MNTLKDNSRTLCYSTGGIIALGIGVQGWTVDDSIKRFSDFCSGAFTARQLHGIPVFQHMVTYHHEGSRFQTKPLEDVLKTSFQEEPLFGGLHQRKHYSTKVGVLATKADMSKALILTNYNRPLHRDEIGRFTWNCSLAASGCNT